MMEGEVGKVEMGYGTGKDGGFRQIINMSMRA